MKILHISFLLLATCCYAQDKMKVSLNDGSNSTVGRAERPESVKVELRKGFGSKPIPVEEKISALKQKLRFYELGSHYKIDLGKEINAVYTDKPLKSILAELFPAVPIKFEGVDSDVTVESMAIVITPLETVCEYLDAAAGVYFRFTDQGITVMSKPDVK